MLTEIPLGRLMPSTLNPRKHFDQVALDELAASIRLDGVLENLIVRPEWCVGMITANDLANAHGSQVAIEQQRFEIVSGERRYRAALEAYVNERGDVPILIPVRIKPMTDPQSLRINLTEQLQRNQLTPLEEAAGFAQMLSYRDELDAPLHTAAGLAAEMGKAHDYVLGRIALLELPDNLREAVDAGTVAANVVKLVARIPQQELREEAGRQALTGGRDGGPMTRDELQAHLNEKYMKQLKGAPFDQENPDLVPEAGRCSVCPKRTGNNRALYGDVKRGDVCTDTVCFRSKCQAAFLQLVAVANKCGHKVLTDKESEKLFESVRSTEIRFDCDWVELDTKPMAHLLKAEVKNPPMWRELVNKARDAKMTPETVLAKDGAGRGRFLVNSTLLIAAAEKLGEPIFRGQKGADDVPVTPRPGEDSDEAFRRGQRELNERNREIAKKTAAEILKKFMNRTAGVRAVHAALVETWKTVPVWSVLTNMVLEAGGPPVMQLLAETLGLNRASSAKQILTTYGKGSLAARQAMIPLLLISHEIVPEGIESRNLRRLAAMVSVDLPKVAAEFEASLKAAALAKKKPKPAGKRAAKKRGAK